jgi:hypothetical protein
VVRGGHYQQDSGKSTVYDVRGERGALSTGSRQESTVYDVRGERGLAPTTIIID